MADLLVEYVIQQRSVPPQGFRLLSDGTLLRLTSDNAPPAPTARLDQDRADLAWQAAGTLSPEALEQARAALQAADLFSLPPVLLINYCKDDPPTGIWQVTLDGQRARIVVFDPRPKRQARLDALLAALEPLLATE
ncbi:MAG: hypothetical protein DYG88_06130 [Chloroflexi bacterium CFX4]|nr:hypothetical protein [Chloroflexi bacterium CFX4]MDL1922812.1 hypothetical protein [Chloroflexi bacterium CFX3]